MADTKRFGGPGGKGQGQGQGQGRGRPTTVPPPANPGGRVRPASSYPAIGGEVGPEDSRKTVMMTAPDLLPPKRVEEIAAPEPSSPMAEVQRPPQIDLVRHDLPKDAPLDARLVLVTRPDSEQAAAFRVLRHHLLERGRPRVLAVSSPNDGDGKTTCAVNLALALGECGRARVLLVDGNLRNPDVASVFRFVPPWCFAEQLKAHREQALLPWGVVDIPEQTIHVAAINPRREPGLLLDAPAFGIAMERLRRAQYDHIVIDCPSVLAGADVNLIQDSADGVVLVTRRKATRARDLRRAVEQLSPSKIVGLTLLE